MTPKSDPAPVSLRPSRFMSMAEVAAELGWKSRGPVYELVQAGQLDAAAVGATGRGLRITRKSFDAYCNRIEEEGRRRFRVAS